MDMSSKPASSKRPKAAEDSDAARSTKRKTRNEEEGNAEQVQIPVLQGELPQQPMAAQQPPMIQQIIAQHAMQGQQQPLQALQPSLIDPRTGATLIASTELPVALPPSSTMANNTTDTTTQQAEEGGTTTQNEDLGALDNGFSSLYHGVSKHKKGKQWRVQLRKKNISSYYKTELEAAHEYDRLVRLHELKNPLNFPTEEEKVEGRSVSKIRKSKFRGVNIHKRSNKWRATLYVNGKMQHIGYYNTDLEAAQAYDKEVVIGPKNREINFPKDYPEYEFIRGVTKRKKREVKYDAPVANISETSEAKAASSSSASNGTTTVSTASDGTAPVQDLANAAALATNAMVGGVQVGGMEGVGNPMMLSGKQGSSSSSLVGVSQQQQQQPPSKRNKQMNDAGRSSNVALLSSMAAAASERPNEPAVPKQPPQMFTEV